MNNLLGVQMTLKFKQSKNITEMSKTTPSSDRKKCLSIIIDVIENLETLLRFKNV